MEERSHYRGLSIVGPFILIGIGIVLLLQQLNMIQWSFWEVAFRLWPLIIIAVGADILIARRSYIGAVASLLVVLGLFVGGIYLMGTGPGRTGGTLTSEEVAYDLGDAASGEINLTLDAGKMTEINSKVEIEPTCHMDNGYINLAGFEGYVITPPIGPILRMIQRSEKPVSPSICRGK